MAVASVWPLRASAKNASRLGKSRAQLHSMAQDPRQPPCGRDNTVTKLPPMTTDYLEKLEHIRGAVAHHMYEEEGNWFIDLKEKAPAADQVQITRRYEEEFTRYVGANVGAFDTRIQTTG
jgi:hypothetical protein